MTETLPEGLNLQIAKGLNISEAQAVQPVTIYGIGSVVSAVLVVLAAQSWRRRPLLLLMILIFFVEVSFTSNLSFSDFVPTHIDT